MKKLRSNGGYALVYVVAAMTLMLAIVGGVTVTASRNLKTQQSAVSMMEERYAAAGEVEAKFAKIAGIKSTTFESAESGFGSGFRNLFQDFGTIVETDAFGANRESGSFTVKVSESSDNTTVTADILVRYTVTSKPPASDGESYTYTVTVTSVSYEGYKVEYKEST